MARKSYDILDLANACAVAIHRMEAMEKMPTDFGTGDLLNRSEIHTIMAIGRNENTNITNLAEQLEVSKSAISQMTRKLFEDGLVEKYQDPKNDKEILLRLTPRGRVAYLGHEQFHAKYDEWMLRNIGQLNDDEYETVKRFIAAIESATDAVLNKKI